MNRESRGKGYWLSNRGNRACQICSCTSRETTAIAKPRTRSRASGLSRHSKKGSGVLFKKNSLIRRIRVGGNRFRQPPETCRALQLVIGGDNARMLYRLKNRSKRMRDRRSSARLKATLESNKQTLMVGKSHHAKACGGMDNRKAYKTRAKIGSKGKFGE